MELKLNEVPKWLWILIGIIILSTIYDLLK